MIGRGKHVAPRPEGRRTRTFGRAVPLALALVMVMAAVAFASTADTAVADVTAPTDAVTIAPGGNADINIRVTVRGRQDSQATFGIETDWTLTGGAFAGANEVTRTVNPRAAADDPTIFDIPGKVYVATGHACSATPHTLAIKVHVISTSAPAALGVGSASDYDVTVAGCAPADTTAPTSTATGTNADDSAYTFGSWTNQNVTVSLDATDNAGGSGVKHLTYKSAAGSAQSVSQATVLAANLPAGPTINAEGTTTLEFWAEDNQGNIEDPANTAVVMIDKTAPTSTPDFTDGTVFQLGDTLPTVACSSSDTLSGIATGGTLSGPTGSGTTNPNGVGTFTYSCNGATDNAGNTQSTAGTKSFTVQYDLTGVGIRQPINPDNSSLFSRGKAVPVKFGLNGSNPYVMTGWKLIQQQTNCSVGGEDIGTSVEAVAENPSNSFRYDSAADQYIYNANFKDKLVGSCWKAGVQLDSGQTFWSAIFKLQK